MYTTSIHHGTVESIDELFELYNAVGWNAGSTSRLAVSVGSYSLVVTARSAEGVLVGYTSVFSDGAYTTFIGEILVHPDHRRQGIARAMVERVAHEFPSIPIVVHTLPEAGPFFSAIGFRTSSAEMTALFRPAPNPSTPSPP